MVLLRSGVNGGCATAAIVSPGLLLTNAHVTDLVCPYNNCSKLEVLRAGSLGAAAREPLDLGKIEVASSLHALDIATLRYERKEALAAETLNFALPVNGEKIKALGFPRCGPLTESLGAINSLSNLHIHTDARSAHGSSGSLVLNANSEIVGLLDQSDSLLDALQSLVTGKSFPARGVRGDVLSKLISLPTPKLALEAQAELLMDYHHSQVSTRAGNGRVWPALTFISMVDGFRLDAIAVAPAEEAQALLAVGEFPATLPPDPQQQSRLANLVELVTIAHNLEYKGAFESLLTPLQMEGWQAALTASGRSNAQIESLVELVKPALEMKLQGLIRVLTRWAALAICGVLLALGLWCLSLGYAWAWFNGSLLRRLVATTLFAALWPVSLLAFMLPASARKVIRAE
ncbi:MAG: serine protease [Oligoflexia bacterium]|nr:serine protease [Oligoflexia bacterium]